jgi:hypothetical protein
VHGNRAKGGGQDMGASSLRSKPTDAVKTDYENRVKATLEQANSVLGNSNMGRAVTDALHRALGHVRDGAPLRVRTSVETAHSLVRHEIRFGTLSEQDRVRAESLADALAALQNDSSELYGRPSEKSHVRNLANDWMTSVLQEKVRKSVRRK